MKRLLSLFSLSLIAFLGLAGCKNNTDERSYDSVGEDRVFDKEERASAEKSRSYFHESVPAPARVAEAPAARPQTVQAAAPAASAPRTREIAVSRPQTTAAPARRHNAVGEREVFE